MPEITADYIRLPVRAKKAGEQVRTIELSKAQGIKALVAYKQGGKSAIMTYLFDRKKWDMGKAKKWVKEHSSGA